MRDQDLSPQTLQTVLLLPGAQYTLGTRGFFSRATGSFVSSAAGGHVFGRRPKARAVLEGHFLRLDRNRKLRMKSLRYPG